MRPGERGFSYLMLLGWVALSGVMLMALGTHWRNHAQREREVEMVFRAEQIQHAIESYARVPVRAGESPWPPTLEALLTDERSGVLVRHLRQPWLDPMTGQPWGLVREGTGIRGVYSTSRLTPLRAPKGVERFDAWRFEATLGTPAASPTTPPITPPDTAASLPSQQTVTPAP